MEVVCSRATTFSTPAGGPHGSARPAKPRGVGHATPSEGARRSLEGGTGSTRTQALRYVTWRERDCNSRGLGMRKGLVRGSGGVSPCARWSRPGPQRRRGAAVGTSPQPPTFSKGPYPAERRPHALCVCGPRRVEGRAAPPLRGMANPGAVGSRFPSRPVIKCEPSTTGVNREIWLAPKGHR